MATELPNGRYDAVIIDVDRRADGVAIQCTITAGEHRGVLVDLVSATMRVRDELSLLGVPCTLEVDGTTIRLLDL